MLHVQRWFSRLSLWIKFNILIFPLTRKIGKRLKMQFSAFSVSFYGFSNFSKGLCHEDFAVLVQFCAKIIT